MICAYCKKEFEPFTEESKIKQATKYTFNNTKYANALIILDFCSNDCFTKWYNGNNNINFKGSELKYHNTDNIVEIFTPFYEK